MKQVRYTEYEDIMRNASDYPRELDHMNSRLNKKIRRIHARRLLTVMGAFIGVVILFTGVVNTSAVFAQAVENIPIIRDLAEYVKFDKGLQNAIKNKYAQKVNLKQEANGLTLKMPYVIADRKRLVLFFQLPEKLTNQSKVNKYQVVLDDSYWGKLSRPGTQYEESMDEAVTNINGLVAISIRSREDIPQDITLPVSIVRLFSTTNGMPFDKEEEKGRTVASYEFKLHLNEYKDPIITVLNKEVQMLDQTVIIKSIAQYPTGVEIKATIPNNKTEIISGLQITGIDKNDNKWYTPEQTEPAYTYHDDEVNMTYFLENDYFKEASLDRLEITGVGMFKKENQLVTIDLVNQTMTPDISDLYIRRINQDKDTAYIIFESTATGLNFNDIMGTFDSQYYDLKGNTYEIEKESGSQIDGKIQYYIPVKWNKDNKVVLMRVKAPITRLENPIIISLGK